MKKCPFCAEEIQEAAIVCKHCGRDIESRAPIPRQNKYGAGTALLLATGMLGALGLIGSLLLGPTPAPQWDDHRHRAAILNTLAADQRAPPKSIDFSSSGVVVVKFELTPDEVRNLSVPVKTYAETRLLLIREVLLPDGFKDFQVDIIGPSPGTGLFRHYGTSRITSFGSGVEWVKP